MVPTQVVPAPHGRLARVDATPDALNTVEVATHLQARCPSTALRHSTEALGVAASAIDDAAVIRRVALLESGFAPLAAATGAIRRPRAVAANADRGTQRRC